MVKELCDALLRVLTGTETDFGKVKSYEEDTHAMLCSIQAAFHVPLTELASQLPLLFTAHTEWQALIVSNNAQSQFRRVLSLAQHFLDCSAHTADPRYIASVKYWLVYCVWRVFRQQALNDSSSGPELQPFMRHSWVCNAMLDLTCRIDSDDAHNCRQSALRAMMPRVDCCLLWQHALISTSNDTNAASACENDSLEFLRIFDGYVALVSLIAQGPNSDDIARVHEALQTMVLCGVIEHEPGTKDGDLTALVRHLAHQVFVE
ncbi:MAG: hypothetical protein MHM6MM_005270 [Cercozoa sp. M6MM]